MNSFIQYRLELEKKAFLKIKGKVVTKANQLITGLTKAGYRKMTANIIAIFAAVLMTTPFSITTLLASLDVIGAWGVIPGLGIVEGTFIYTFAVHIRNINKLYKVLRYFTRDNVKSNSKRARRSSMNSETQLKADLKQADIIIRILLVVILVLTLVMASGCHYETEAEKAKVENGVKEVAVLTTAIFLGLTHRSKNLTNSEPKENQGEEENIK